MTFSDDTGYTEQTIQALVAAYDAVPLHAFAGLTFHRDPEHGWVGQMTVTAPHAPGGYLHGGLVYAFIDVAASFALEAHLGPYFYSRTVALDVNLLRAARTGSEVVFRARIERVADGLAFVRAEAWVSIAQGDRCIAYAQSTKRLRDRRQAPRDNDLDFQALAEQAAPATDGSSTPQS